ncbi:bacteriochlorophyll 4-vinyl reductase [Roseobacter sinensis]|uniref:Bacteriochlorophyll 4-vinyl reductase n=1 Tax=Roseobacter sinensis TaxID=2931391 RepID=A0ABT3BD32_9RHOB|nr:bacteriochlorophyll 4-vinyl reductase [Roseobacter sp. WL0113]MCV3271314.1 bacteriochlorophyll 4-vinyl reductase [Roseobacter sp. WL0113]
MAGAAEGLIGPNAVLQMLPQIERLGGRDRVDRMLAAAGILEVPDGSAMIPEGDAARLHRLIRAEEPVLAPELAAAAGDATARYILAHRIPKAAQHLMRVLPAWGAVRLLSRAIAAHAWTFAGSGEFSAQSPWRFEILSNPVIRGEVSTTPLCAWHAAVFEGLYRTLVHPACRCVETRCGAQPGCDTCAFEISLAATNPSR